MVKGVPDSGHTPTREWSGDWGKPYTYLYLEYVQVTTASVSIPVRGQCAGRGGPLSARRIKAQSINQQRQKRTVELWAHREG